MNIKSKSKTDDQKSRLSFDISEDKEKFKEQTTDSINGQFKKIQREDIKKVVDDKYEELLYSASVTHHIPAVTEGQIKSHFRAKVRNTKNSW